MLELIQEEQIPKQMLPVECVATILSSIEVGFTLSAVSKPQRKCTVYGSNP